jgi:hypothetical protein
VLVKPATDAFAPGFAGIVTGGAIVSLPTLVSIQYPAAEECELRNAIAFGIIARSWYARYLYVGVAIVLLGMLGHTTFVSGEAAERWWRTPKAQATCSTAP